MKNKSVLPIEFLNQLIKNYADKPPILVHDLYIEYQEYCRFNNQVFNITAVKFGKELRKANISRQESVTKIGEIKIW